MHLKLTLICAPAGFGKTTLLSDVPLAAAGWLHGSRWMNPTTIQLAFWPT